MDVKTYRAATMQDALAMVWEDLGSDAAVLHTREVCSRRWFGWLPEMREIEVTASCDVNVPSRLPPQTAVTNDLPPLLRPTAPVVSPLETMPPQVHNQLAELQSLVKNLCRRTADGPRDEMPPELFRLFTELLECDLSEQVARGLVARLRSEAPAGRMLDPVLLKGRIAQMIEAEIAIAGPLRITPGHCRVAALVGPTGVGKTTTIAKLAAHYRLKEKHRVGLITVDTYRIAAVEQLRTYADIIDLPMQVVSTPREMREAVRRMDDLDLVLLDTAGRSPKDEVRIQELKSFLSEAEADEVHLVLSSVAAERSLGQTAQRFAAAGTTAMIVTKLDEATGLGNLLPLLRNSKLPLSYLTNGQNVPDDIEVADAHRLTELMLK
jgi:flagellar biosynthesis protein FlhF